MSEPRTPAGGGASESDWSGTSGATTDLSAEGERAPGGFTPGTMLAGRYRVVAPLGRGGMGEVYRADDTKLGQAVALKFLRGALSPELLQRLYAEVRLGRQVSHPAVCRLYDVVEIDGQTFLAMEYVDGEDLASLLARIGRLPADKATDIARDLAAGLAAVHDRGIVHRDLKPANVMIDGRGRARITDFGLAVALEGPGRSGFAGTPAYMAPEQIAGGEVGVFSDLYALGLIVYEMATGRRFYDCRTLDELTAQHRAAKEPRLASVADRMDPALQRLVLRCLEEDPAVRLRSARAAEAMLPGGDVLDAAIAAGETPSPETVAAAGRVGDLSAGAAWTLLGVTVGGLAVAAALFDRGSMLSRIAPPKPPEVLVERAREIVAQTLPAAAAGDAAWAFEWDLPQLSALTSAPAAERWRNLAGEGFGPLAFFYRQSPRPLVAVNRDAAVSREDPPSDVPGMASVTLDARGRLLSVLAVPPRVESAAGVASVDWRPFFDRAGLAMDAFRRVSPQWSAPVDSDAKAAWEGTYPGETAAAVRIEAASYHGRPVWFAVLPPWSIAKGANETYRGPPTIPVAETAVWILALAMPLGGALLARRNLRIGRGDRPGAFRVAAFVFVTYAVARAFRADHVAEFGTELWIVIKVLAYPAFWAMQVWLLYMALEPYARRRWPAMLISWKRLLSGRLSDPMVGRDLLIGLAAGTLVIVIIRLPVLLGDVAGAASAPENLVHGSTLTAMRDVGFRVFVNQYSAVLYGLVFLFILVLLRMLVRRTWLAAALWLAILAAPLHSGNLVVDWISAVTRAAVMGAALIFGGLLGLVTALFVFFAGIEVPLTLHGSAWYASRALPVVAVVVALALYAFHAALGGKSAIGGALED